MGRIAVLGDPAVTRGWALAGLLVAPAVDPTEVRAAWAELPDDVELVILTAAAAAALDAVPDDDSRLRAVLP